MTLEQHGFELCGSTYMWIFFPINTYQSITRFPSWLNPQMRNTVCGGLTIRQYMGFWLRGGLVPLTPVLFKVNCIFSFSVVCLFYDSVISRANVKNLMVWFIKKFLLITLFESYLRNFCVIQCHKIFLLGCLLEILQFWVLHLGLWSILS